jgi:hypothetical protein
VALLIVQNATGPSASTAASYVEADGAGVQPCASTGEPPVQPAGDAAVTVRVCVPLELQALQPVYVNDVHVTGGGVQPCASTGEPPVQPAGDAAVTVRVCVPLELQALQPVYVNDVHSTGGTSTVTVAVARVDGVDALTWKIPAAAGAV